MPRIIKVFSKDNHFQHIEVLKRNREKRHRHQKIFVEGVSSIKLALANNWKFDALIYAQDRALSDWAQETLRRADPKSIYELAPGLMEELSEKDEPSELLALVEKKPTSLSQLTLKSDGLVVVCDRPGSHGNLGTSIRSADAFGADALCVSGHAVDPFDPKVLRSSVGTIFSLPIIPLEGPREITEFVRRSAESGTPYSVIGTDVKGEHELGNYEFKGPIVLLMGNETVGLSKAYIELCDTTLRIPIMGAASSLNVSSALAITLFEVQRQRARSL
jgi:23S rRNA (uridine2479-2'-O)-methyltransferase